LHRSSRINPRSKQRQPQIMRSTRIRTRTERQKQSPTTDGHGRHRQDLFKKQAQILQLEHLTTSRSAIAALRETRRGALSFRMKVGRIRFPLPLRSGQALFAYRKRKGGHPRFRCGCSCDESRSLVRKVRGLVMTGTKVNRTRSSA